MLGLKPSFWLKIGQKLFEIGEIMLQKINKSKFNFSVVRWRSASDAQSAVVAQMLAHGLPPPDRLDFGRLVYYEVGGRQQKKAWHALYPVRANHDGVSGEVIVGAFGMWGADLPEKGITVRPDYSGLVTAHAQILQIQAQRRQEMAAQALVDERKRRLEAARKWVRREVHLAQHLHQNSSASLLASSAYLRRKCVDLKIIQGLMHSEHGGAIVSVAEQLGQRGDWSAGAELLIPALSMDGLLRGAQLIWPGGEKRFVPGTQKQASFARLNAQIPHGGLILLVEGIATGLTVFEAIEQRFWVVVAWDCGNLLRIAQAMRQAHPTARLLICADDDWHGRVGVRTSAQALAKNAGVRHAVEAMKRIDRCDVTWPIWPPGVLRRERDTDFNDLAVSAGIEVVRRQLAVPIKQRLGIDLAKQGAAV